MAFILDGPTGTELVARGYKTHPLLWTARAALEAPHLLKKIHKDYVVAGANIITANTFRANPYLVRKAGFDEGETRRMIHTSIAVATDVVEDSRTEPRCMLAASVSPLEDCYHPERTPDQATLKQNHALVAAWLAEAGCDIILIETMGTAREAVIAVEAAKSAGFENVWTSFIVRENGEELLGGDKLTEAARQCVSAGSEAVLVNCVHADVIERALFTLQGSAAALGAYANASHMTFELGQEPRWQEDIRPVAEQACEYAEHAARWVSKYDARIIGSCCGTTVEHTKKIVERLKR